MTTTRRTLYWGLFALWCAISIACIYDGMENPKSPALGRRSGCFISQPGF